MKNKTSRVVKQARSPRRQNGDAPETPEQKRKRKRAEELSDQKRKEACKELGREKFPEQCG